MPHSIAVRHTQSRNGVAMSIYPLAGGVWLYVPVVPAWRGVPAGLLLGGKREHRRLSPWRGGLISH